MGTATMRFARMGEFGGMDVAADESVASLERLGFTVAARSETGPMVVVATGPLDAQGAVCLLVDDDATLRRGSARALDSHCDAIRSPVLYKYM
jgi:phenylalanyl-tRNA synthetase beta chain